MAGNTPDRLTSELHALRLTLERLTVTLAAVGRVTEDHEARVRVLERRQQQITAVISAATFLLGVLATELIGRLL